MENVNLRGVHYFVNIYQFNQLAVVVPNGSGGQKMFKSLYHSLKCAPLSFPDSSALCTEEFTTKLLPPLCQLHYNTIKWGLQEWKESHPA